MKSYSDLEQSMKLAEILPIESADQTWVRIAIAGANLDVPEELQYRHNGDMPFQFYSGIGIPCWSLAALLRVLPYPELREQYNGNWTCKVSNAATTYLWEDDNPIDACVAMIEKLHEQKLL